MCAIHVYIFMYVSIILYQLLRPDAYPFLRLLRPDRLPYYGYDFASFPGPIQATSVSCLDPSGQSPSGSQTTQIRPAGLWQLKRC